MAASQWQHVDIVYTKDATVAYLNGVRVSKCGKQLQSADILGDNGIFWIEKQPGAVENIPACSWTI